MIDRQPCGCKHDGHEWKFMCEPCKAEFTARHEQAQREHFQTEGAKRLKEIL